MTPLHRPLVPSGRRSRLGRSIILLISLLGLATNGNAESALVGRSVADGSNLGKFYFSARYRAEIYQQDTVPGAVTAAAGRVDGDAIASTLRLTLAYESTPVFGFTALVEGAGVYALGEKENYRILNHPTQGNKPRAIIADPLGTTLNQALLRWTAPTGRVTVVAGRDPFFLNNGRFISYSAWRQKNQTIDLARIGVKLPASWTAAYAYLDRVHRVVGPAPTDGDLGMNSHVGSLDFIRKGVVNASLYTVLLDYTRADQAANDTASTGLRLTGPYVVNPAWNVVYTFDYARQSDHADNPRAVGLDYFCVELGIGHKAHKAFVGWTRLEAAGGATFRTPLAHPFNGWVEKFVSTPATGLDAYYVTGTGAVPQAKGLTYTVTVYDYYADHSRLHYGWELDAALEWQAEVVAKNLTFGWRLGRYFADRLATDSLRTSVYAQYKR